MTPEDIQKLKDFLATRGAYIYMTDNHPTIHSNRFCSWEELSEHAQDQMVETFKRKGTLL